MSDRDPDHTAPSPDSDTARADEDDTADEEVFDPETEEPLVADDEERSEVLDETPFDTDAPPDEPFDALGDAGEADPFTEMDANPETVGDEVFEMIESDEEQPADLNIERDPDVVEMDEGVVVPKQSYCERCPHFSEPPTVACTNPGTTIHELVDLNHFRVSDCPIVEEQEEGRSPRE